MTTITKIDLSPIADAEPEQPSYLALLTLSDARVEEVKFFSKEQADMCIGALQERNPGVVITGV